MNELTDLRAPSSDLPEIALPLLMSDLAGYQYPAAPDTAPQPHLSLCRRCGLVTFDGLHRYGSRDCFMDEIEVAP